MFTKETSPEFFFVSNNQSFEALSMFLKTAISVILFSNSDIFIGKKCEIFFRAAVNNSRRSAFIFMDNDSKEKNVNTGTAELLIKNSFIDRAEDPPTEAAAENSEIEQLGALFRAHHQTIFRAAYRITGSASDAEDVLQTIFLRLTPPKGSRDFSQNPEGYLYRAAVNASLDLLRSRARANAISLDAADFTQTAQFSAPSPEQNLADDELRALVRHAIAKLEGRAATAFALRYFEGYDNGRIAEVLGTSQMVVAVTLHRARTRLRKEIGSYLEKHHDA